MDISFRKAPSKCAPEGLARLREPLLKGGSFWEMVYNLKSGTAKGFPCDSQSPVPVYDRRQWPKYGWISASLCEKCWRRTDLTRYTQKKIYNMAESQGNHSASTWGEEGIVVLFLLFNRNYNLLPLFPKVMILHLHLHSSQCFTFSQKLAVESISLCIFLFVEMLPPHSIMKGKTQLALKSLVSPGSFIS